MEQSTQTSNTLQTGAPIRCDEHDRDADRKAVPHVQNRMAQGEAGGIARLISKLASVMGEVGHIPKNGHNAHFDYKFARDVDVMEAVQSKFAAHKLLLVPSVEGHRREGKLSMIDMRFTVYDGDTGASISFNWVGYGEDSSDKSIWKAITGGVKYAIMKLLLVPTGDDPEATDEHGKATSQRRAQRPTASEAGVPDTRPITPQQLARLKGLLKTHTTNMDEFGAWIKTRFAYATSAGAIHRCDYDAVTTYVIEGTDSPREPGSDD